jgi:hypothetical protein
MSKNVDDFKIVVFGSCIYEKPADINEKLKYIDKKLPEERIKVHIYVN